MAIITCWSIVVEGTIYRFCDAATSITDGTNTWTPAAVTKYTEPQPATQFKPGQHDVFLLEPAPNRTWWRRLRPHLGIGYPVTVHRVKSENPLVLEQRFKGVTGGTESIVDDARGVLTRISCRTDYKTQGEADPLIVEREAYRSRYPNSTLMDEVNLQRQQIWQS